MHSDSEKVVWLVGAVYSKKIIHIIIWFISETTPKIHFSVKTQHSIVAPQIYFLVMSLALMNFKKACAFSSVILSQKKDQDYTKSLCHISLLCLYYCHDNLFRFKWKMKYRSGRSVVSASWRFLFCFVK